MAVGTVVASDTRDLWFESSHRQFFYVVSVNCVEKTKNKKTGNGPFLKKVKFFTSLYGCVTIEEGSPEVFERGRKL